ncbi:MAG TPA: hypothetical protein VHU80_02375 [Polyangiaceae bacterium]|nr:hypothetical protein [Polyangiaceae bacterium]
MNRAQLYFILATVAFATNARANPFGYHQHDGFYLRMSGGLASLDVRRSTEVGGAGGSVAFAGDGSRVVGASLFTELSVGGTPVRHVVIAGTLLGNGLPATELKLASGSRIDLGTPLVFAMLGPSIDVFPDEYRGFHAGGGIGVATTTAGVKDPIFSAIGGLGVGVTLALGYDFWTGDDWSVGFVARGIVARIEGEQESNATVGREQDVVSSASLAVSILYH